jgi:hypothetical protein
MRRSLWRRQRDAHGAEARFHLESSEKACAVALLPCTCRTVFYLPLYSVLLNSRPPLRPIATFGVFVIREYFL